MTYRMARQVCVLAAISGIPLLLMAQEEGPAAEVSGSSASVQAQSLAPEQLADLVAPIALYPDPLLSQVLVASTYPLEVVEAQQWLQRNGRLRGQKLMDAAQEQNWDASVQGLVAFPDVLAKMNQDVQWTTALGDAFLAHQADVMDAVQRMRTRAQANGKLSSSPEQSVTTETPGEKAVIEIVPADPQVIYVPEYDPDYIWGSPAWGYYPPLAYASYGFGFGPAIDIGFCFGGWNGWGWRGWGWGWGPNWFGGSVFVNTAFFRHHGFHGGFLAGGFAGRRVWRHDPGHRLGVPYRNAQLAARYQSASLASRSTMARSGNFNSARPAGTGSWNRLGPGTASTHGSRSITQGVRTATPWSTGHTTAEAWRRFPGAQREQVPTQRYSAPVQRYSAPVQRYSAPVQRYSAPVQRYPSSAPRMSPTGSGGRRFGGVVGSYGSSRGGGVSGAGSGHTFGGGSHGVGHRR